MGTGSEFDHVQVSIRTLLQKFLDGNISKSIFDEGHGALLMRRSRCEEKLSRLSTEQDMQRAAEAYLGNLRSLCERFCSGSQEEMRKIVDQVCQSITTSGKMIHITLTPFMEHLATRRKTTDDWLQLFPVVVKTLAGV